MMRNRLSLGLLVAFGIAAVSALLVACAGDRQGVVCSEIQYRLDTQTYSPDQRAYIENELRECREEEAKKRGADAATRQGIYERYAASNQADTTAAADTSEVISVSKALQDSSGVETVSIYDRYKAVDSTATADTTAHDSSAQATPDTAAAEAGSFQ